VVAMMNVAASGGYYISLPADWIVAHPTTFTGSIGVIFARPGVSGFMEKTGLTMEVNTSGELKDMGSPFRPPTEKEKVIFQELTDTLAQRFLDLVTQHRHLQPAQREKIASARIYLADDAMRLGLVDQIGYLNDAIDKAISLGGLGPDARVVTYRRDDSKEATIYNGSGSQQPGSLDSAVPVLAPIMAISEAGFYYLWPSSI
jgi:protease-4